MTLQQTSLASKVSTFLPRLSTPSATVRQSTTLFTRQLTYPLLPNFETAIPVAISINIPSLLGGLWESILRAVPKKKTSHMKKRHRQMAGKALKDVTSLNRCSACGHV